MTDEERDLLIEEATSAWRLTEGEGPGSHPAWDALDEKGRLEAFDATSALRRMEAALDPEGMSTTARAVLGRLAEAKPSSNVIPLRARSVRPRVWAIAAAALLAVGVGKWLIDNTNDAPIAEKEQVQPADSEQAPVKHGELQEGEGTELPEPASPQTPRKQDVSRQGLAQKQKREQPGLAVGETPTVEDPPTAKKAPEEAPQQVAEQKAAPEPVVPQQQAAPSEELPALAEGKSAGATQKALVEESQGAPDRKQAADPKHAACETRVKAFERRVQRDAEYVPKPTVQLAVGSCYKLLKQRKNARVWLERAARHSETKARAESALKEMSGE